MVRWLELFFLWQGQNAEKFFFFKSHNDLLVYCYSWKRTCRIEASQPAHGFVPFLTDQKVHVYRAKNDLVLLKKDFCLSAMTTGLQGIERYLWQISRIFEFHHRTCRVRSQIEQPRAQQVSSALGHFFSILFSSTRRFCKSGSHRQDRDTSDW